MHRLHNIIRTACQISEKIQTRRSRNRAAPRLGRSSEPFPNFRLLENRRRFALSKGIQISLIAFESTSKFFYQFGLFSNFEWIFQDSLKPFPDVRLPACSADDSASTDTWMQDGSSLGSSECRLVRTL